MSVAHPWLLVLLSLLVAGLALLAWRWRASPSWWLRIVALLVLACAASGLGWQRQSPGLVILEDVSDSAQTAPVLPSNAQTLARLRFAGKTGNAAREDLQPEQSNLEQALQVAGGYNPTRILLLSDGQESQGNALLALPNVPVDVLPLAAKPNLRPTQLSVSAAAPGTRVRATVTAESNLTGRGRLYARVGNELLPAQSIAVRPGRQSFALEFTMPQERARLELRFDLGQAEPSLDNRIVTDIGQSNKDQIRVVNDPVAARLLRAQGFAVREIQAKDLVDFEVQNGPIVVRGAATQFSRGQLSALARFVANGGGLLMTGSPQGYGLGAWLRTPLEARLPVRSDLRTRIEVPLVAMVMVVDRSLSMVGGTPQKLGLALEGVASVIDLASEQDRLGLITFSDDPRWSFHLTRASESNKLQMLRALDAVQATGGTILAPAYQEAIEALRQSNASVKHLIVLTDGQLADNDSGNSVDFAALASAARREGITTTGIGVGDDADTKQLSAMAKAGGGRYHAAINPETLPRIFTLEALTISRALVRQQSPVRALQNSLWQSPKPPAMVSGYVATTLHPEAEAILLGKDDEPLVAFRRVELGRSAALTFDLARNDALTRWPALPALVGTLGRWLVGTPSPYRLGFDEDGRQVQLDVVRNNAYQNNQRFTARIAGQTLALAQTAPGRYSLRLPDDATGTLTVQQGGEVVARAERPAQNLELRPSNGAALLAQIASRTGGRVLQQPEIPENTTRRQTLAWQPWLLMLACMVLLLELLLRRSSSER